jgi:capsule biosynthesis phosphatase
MKRIVIDLDGTITLHNSASTYADKSPNKLVAEKLRIYKSMGFEIIIQTARNMNTYNNSVGKINANTLPEIIAWLNKYDIPYDEIHVGKPWCGTEGFYVDDRSIRPGEFVDLSLEQIHSLLSKEHKE